jgi:hypothetical protein
MVYSRHGLHAGKMGSEEALPFARSGGDERRQYS